MIIETSGTYSRNYNTHRHRFYYNKSTDKTRGKTGIDIAHVILRYMSTDRNTVWLMINGKKYQKQDVTEM